MKTNSRNSAFNRLECKHGKVKPLQGCRACKFSEVDHCKLDEEELDST